MNSNTKQRQTLLQNFAREQGLSQKTLPYLNQALTHKSRANELAEKKPHKKLPDIQNQRLEFLGDAVLGLIVAQELFERYPDQNEGLLSKRKAQAVCEPTLSEVAYQLNLGSMLKLGKGEAQSGGHMRESNLADALESVIGAVYLCESFDKTRALVVDWLRPYIEANRVTEGSKDYKSQLQEWLMGSHQLRPEYKLLENYGPEHQKEFLVALYIKGKECARGKGGSRKRAEQQAAKNYLEAQSNN